MPGYGLVYSNSRWANSGEILIGVTDNIKKYQFGIKTGK